MYLVPKASSKNSIVHSASYFMGIAVAFTVTKRPGHEPDYSNPSSAEVENKWRYSCSSCIRLHTGHRCNFTVLLSQPDLSLEPHIYKLSDDRYKNGGDGVLTRWLTCMSAQIIHHLSAVYLLLYRVSDRNLMIFKVIAL